MRAALPTLLTPTRLRARVRKPINWRKVGLTVGIPAVLACAAVVGWYFLPREFLPPERIGTILDRATTGTALTFNDGAPGRKTVLLSTGTDVWEIPSGESIYQGPTLGYSLSPDGETSYTGDALLMWRAKKTTTLEKPAPYFVSVIGGSSLANGYPNVIFSNDGRLVASERVNGSLYLLDAGTGKLVHRLREGGNSISKPSDEKQICHATSLAFSRDDSILASGELNGDITLWKTDTGDRIQVLHGEDSQSCDGTAPQPLDLMSQVLGLGFSPDGRLLASEDNYWTVRIWEVSSGKALYILPFHVNGGARHEVRFSPDGLPCHLGRSSAGRGMTRCIWCGIRSMAISYRP